MTDDVQDPFADRQDKKDSVEIKLSIDFETVIRRLAEIKDELSSLGISDLLDEEKRLREVLKAAMRDAGSINEYDEMSNYEGVLMPQMSDIWDVSKFEKMLSPAQRKRYIEKAPIKDAVKDGIKSGDLSRGALEYKGAVTKTPGVPKLYVRERKDGSDG